MKVLGPFYRCWLVEELALVVDIALQRGLDEVVLVLVSTDPQAERVTDEEYKQRGLFFYYPITSVCCDS